MKPHNYKRNDIIRYFCNFLTTLTPQEIIEAGDGLHSLAFNEDSYFMKGQHKAMKWLGTVKNTFLITHYICDVEFKEFGKVATDLTNPEEVVNVYAFWIGYDICALYQIHLECQKEKKGKWSKLSVDDFHMSPQQLIRIDNKARYEIANFEKYLDQESSSETILPLN